MSDLHLLPKSEFDRVLQRTSNTPDRLSLFADMCRLNTLVEIKKAGSGHLGSSLSAMDLVVWLYLEVLNVRHVGLASPDRDIFFSSKGHDVPGLYAVLSALGLIEESKLLQLRRLGGLDGHPDVHVKGMEANTGSLGMGISKAKGQAWAKRYLRRGGRVFVMTGDGELQEGQIWESLQTTIHQGVDVTVVVDHNKLQTDMPVEEIIGLRRLEDKFCSFEWAVERCNGHDFAACSAALRRLDGAGRQPKILIADTVKGRGISFMEEIASLASGQGKYLWHSGAPADEHFTKGWTELQKRIDGRLAALGVEPLRFVRVPVEIAQKTAITKQYVAAGYGAELVRLGEGHPELIVLDGDLAADCKVRGFAEKYPNRFIENGIAEQDMVSMAGGLARQGLLPVCNSFSSFLCARANEQIYNNVCEGSKVIYAAHFAGMIPAGPGKSHQSVRDISLLGSLPGLIIVQPASVEEAVLATRWAVEEATKSVCLRLNIGPSPRELSLPSDYRFTPGVGSVLRQGKSAVLFAYGPVMLHESLLAAELLKAEQFDLKVVNHPWLNHFDLTWLNEILAGHTSVIVVEDHLLAGGLGERLVSYLLEHRKWEGRDLLRCGLEELPACGTPVEVLRHHGLDGSSLAARILKSHGRAPPAPPITASPVFDTREAAQ